MFTIKYWDEKEWEKGKMEISTFHDEPITEETLAYALDQLNPLFGYHVEEVKKDGKVLTDEEIWEIKRKYPNKELRPKKSILEKVHDFMLGR